MFKSITPNLDIQQLENEILEFWKNEDIFKRQMEERKDAERYVFYEGPPTANGKPGVHHGLSRAFKDIFPRYHAMTGKYVSRRGGWDTHGLPVEIEVEKRLGFTNKQQIEDYGVAEFNKLCRASAFEYIQEWERFTERLGFWVDFETAYVTYENDYIESVWNILKKFWDQDLLYQGYKVVPYCPRCGTPLSDHEVSLGYKDDTPDPSVHVRLPLVEDPKTSIVIWTTTPWTLPSNTLAAVGPDVEYVTIERPNEAGETERLILAKDLVEKVLGEGEHKVVNTQLGSDLEGVRYIPPFNYVPADETTHKIVLADFVTTTDGTGIVHMAPAYGADDLAEGNKHGAPVFHAVNEKGEFIDAVEEFAGQWFKAADPNVTENLRERGLLLKSSTYLHTYPFCWRCSTPLMYFARTTWYVRTTAMKQELVDLNQTINWTPDHIKDGRFGNWLENNIDWALGRERFWGTPLPVWMDEDGNSRAIGSVAELSELTGKDLSEMDLHRPHVDNITFNNPDNGKPMTRVPELIDVWFDSGAMPYAQWHAPFENDKEFAEQFPADYICEAVDQTRGWFYSLHAISTLLNKEVAYKNVVCLGLILDGEGKKMSKSRGNIVDPWEVFNNVGADAFRWYLYTSAPPGNPRRFSIDLVNEVVRSFTMTLWNTYSFFTTYANLDKWMPSADAVVEYSDLDRWVLSRLHTLVQEVTASLEAYDATGSTRPIESFVNELSNWYVRRSRRRFWKSSSDGDKYAAYATLHECLVTVAKLLAPSMPFLADALYRNLVLSVDESAPISVHLAPWPAANTDMIDAGANSDMALVQKLVSLGHNARNQSSMKVRQPLGEAAFWTGKTSDVNAINRYAEIIADELNVKAVRLLSSAGEAVSYDLHPLPKQMGQAFKNKFPKVRKEVVALADKTAAAKTLLDGGSLNFEIDGESFEVTPDMVEVRLGAQEGFSVAAEGGMVAALVTSLTPELVREGLARELVRRIQDLRKSSGLEISDRIDVTYNASAELAQAIAEHQDYIMSELLANSLIADAALVSEEAYTFGTETVSVNVVKA